ncbi:MAG: AAA family ATPase [Bacteroidales bacterium]
MGRPADRDYRCWGTGKTTLMLQHIKNTFGASGDTLYVSLDDYYFTQHRLFDLAEKFYMNGGLHLFIDEVHKYPSWSIDIKNIYDIFPELKIVFSGSSALQLHKATGDLSRRAAMYHLHELSFREYLNLTLKTNFESILISDILSNHQKLAGDIVKNIRITALFKNYLQNGAYPFFTEAKGQYYDRLINTVNTIIENDLPAIENINYQSVHKLRKLISLIADSVPFKINISELSRKSGLSRDVLIRLLDLLDRASLITNIRQKGAPTGHLTKPDKIYLNNTTLLHALNTNQQVSSGTIRETFFMNQLMQKHQLHSVKIGDFLVDGKYIFEIGGKNKTSNQIAGLSNAYIAADDIEYGYNNTIPLWLFGFLY